MIRTVSRSIRRFRRDQRGAALVEFAMVLPIMLIFFGTTVEGARMMWSYQAASSGVRDASRYLAMVAPIDACTSATAVDGFTQDLERIVRVSISGATVYPGDVTVNSVLPRCVQGTHTGLHFGVVEVTASITIDFPFGRLFTLVGNRALPGLTATVTDQHRVFGT
ncbi:pilus assembly protein [Roseibacterium sp. SDUM158017]|uniref:TadE/TadG family type IV pilus assembly protein n=1 Tax=Roseicyclus salinarum TaxID=3036773 RepID=UPI002414D669|nr:TadE/TadG family type IV pilus assembly protein [Roseibacterium sp. SDUM158017]MDG4647348.1 pilus assembly protein [Roseibacterium sp. SDUM158017]